ncbi:hypothetical protein WJX79_000763 [Trebouxia sp. C0005]
MISAPHANSCSLHAFFRKADVSRPLFLPVTGRSALHNTWLKARNVERHSGQSLAAALLATVLLASPAFGKAPSSEYISVQDRVRQRAPLQRKQSAYNTSNDAAPDLQAKMPSVPQQVAEVRQLSAAAQEATACENYEQALQTYSYITHTYPDLAIIQYARIKHALLLYQAGKTTDAVLEMEGEEEELRGNAEVHAALAAMLYSESPKQIDRAETQWEIAREFDQRFSNLDWVRKEKHWPPAMQTALGNFLNLK